MRSYKILIRLTMLIYTTFLALLGTTLSFVSPKYYELENAESYFEHFKVKYGKSYPSIEEEKMRLSIFKTNLERINRLNKLEGSAVHGISPFTDLTVEEFKSLHKCSLSQSQTFDCTEQNFSNMRLKHLNIPDSLDWRTQNLVSEVKDQAACGSCWAFASIGAVEGLHASSTGEGIVEFSEKQLVDCDTNSNGCDGGSIAGALSYVAKARGVMTEAAYPYQPRRDQCTFDPNNVKFSLKGCYAFTLNDENMLMEILYKYGPTPIDNGTPYWLLKNSYGPNWGINGYAKILRGNNTCGIKNNYVFVPHV